MATGGSIDLFLGAVALGAVHGIEPGHGWPVAASYALDRSNTWFYGLAASTIIGVGHLISSIAMVLVFFWAKGYFELTQVDEPIRILGVTIGGPVSVVAGVVLIALGIREYRHGHGHDHDIEHDDREHAHVHDHDHAHQRNGITGWLRRVVPFVGGHSHAGDDLQRGADRGLLGIAWFAFVLGFAHEEEFEIIALCAGSSHCLELMLAYALTVILGIVGLTLLLIAGFERYEERVERLVPYLPIVSAVVLVTMGLGFVTGVL